MIDSENPSKDCSMFMSESNLKINTSEQLVCRITETISDPANLAVFALNDLRCYTNRPIQTPITEFNDNELVTKSYVNSLLSSNKTGYTKLFDNPASSSNPNIDGIGIITNFQEKNISDSNVDVGCRQSGSQFIFSKKGKYLIIMKNFYRFYNIQENYVSQWCELNNVEHGVCSESVNGNDANVISTLCFNFDVNDSIIFKCYTSSSAGINIEANGKPNPGLLSITLLKDDNASLNFDIPTESSEFLNRQSEQTGLINGMQESLSQSQLLVGTNATVLEQTQSVQQGLVQAQQSQQNLIDTLSTNITQLQNDIDLLENSNQQMLLESTHLELKTQFDSFVSNDQIAELLDKVDDLTRFSVLQTENIQMKNRLDLLEEKLNILTN
jgi:hypothetical protein